MRGVTLSAILSAIGIFVTFFFVPTQLRGYFILLAALGMIAGYFVGFRINKNLKSKVPLWLPVILALACFAFATAYEYKINEVSADTGDIVLDGFLFMAFFFALAFLSKVAGIKLTLSQKIKNRLLALIGSGEK